MKNENVIYTVDKADFDIGGTKYDVAEVSFLASTNGIPQCTVCIAPNDGDGSIVINSLDIVSLKEAFDSLSKQAIKLASSNLDVVVSGRATSAEFGATGGVSTHELKLENWLFVNVGLSQLSTTGAFSISCQIMHPAYVLTTRAGFFFNAAGTLNLDKTCDEVENPLQAAKVTIDALKLANENKIKTLCSTVNTTTPLKMPAEIDGILAQTTVDAQQDLMNLIKWDPEFAGTEFDLPLQKTLSGRYMHGLKYALAMSWIPGGGSSIWDVLTQQICPSYALEVAATWDEPSLSLTPQMPWKPPTYVLNDFMVQEVSFPGMDPDPIFGCILYEGEGSAPPAGSITFPDAASEATAIQPSNLAFVPAKSSNGRLMHLGPGPDWMEMAREKATALVPTPVDATGGVTYPEASASPPSPSSGDNQDLETWNSVKMAFLATQFMINYRQRVDANTVCAFMPDNNGMYVVPGKVAAFVTGDKTLFTGQIGSVEHFINCERSVAYTKLNMSYCQADGANENVLGKHPLCPFYDSI